MTHAYDEMYLEKAQTSLGLMLDFVVHDLGYDVDSFFSLFCVSPSGHAFAYGDVSVIAGRSGIELAYDVLYESGLGECTLRPQVRFDRTPEYWAGWAVAYYQWRTALSFSRIAGAVPISDVVCMYHPFHEMDISCFCEEMDRLYRKANPDTALAQRRRNTGMTQKELSLSSGVSVRTIQQYEQRQKDINKAQAETLLRLSRSLFCNMEDLLEKIV